MSAVKLNRYVAATVVALLLATMTLPVLAGPSGTQAPAGTSTDTTPTSQVAFNRNMQIMHSQMMQLHTTHDSAARAKLLDAHMRTMQQTLHMMMPRGSMGGTGGMGPGRMQGSGMGPGRMQGGMGRGGMRGGNMGGSGGMMSNGQMMQMMMNQMMRHQQAMQTMGCTK